MLCFEGFKCELNFWNVLESCFTDPEKGAGNKKTFHDMDMRFETVEI